MITIPATMAQALGSFLAEETRGRFGSSHAQLAEFLPYAARLTLECIGNSDALYHNIEHSMLVALVGHDILTGRRLLRPTTPRDYSNFILACLTHDIGYVRGAVQGDGDGEYIADVTGRTIRLPIGSSDAAMAPYHVDRSKLFVIERFDTVDYLDADRIARAIEYTRFPYPSASNEGADELIEEEGLLLRAADLIGQLGDPNYMRKANALFHEFEEIGLNKTARLRDAGGRHLQIPAVLLEERRAADPDRDPLSQCHIQRPAMGRQSLQQCFPRRARADPVRPANLAAGASRESVSPCDGY